MAPSSGQIDKQLATKLGDLVQPDGDPLTDNLQASINRCEVTDALIRSINAHASLQRWLRWRSLGGGESRRGGALLSGGFFVPGPDSVPIDSPLLALLSTLEAAISEVNWLSDGDSLQAIVAQSLQLEASRDVPLPNAKRGYVGAPQGGPIPPRNHRHILAPQMTGQLVPKLDQ